MKKTLVLLLAFSFAVLPVGDSFGKTTSSSRSSKSWSSPRSSSVPSSSKPSTSSGSWFSSRSTTPAKPAAASTPPKNSALGALADKQKMAPTAPVTKVPTPQVTKKLPDSPPRPVNSTAAALVPSGKTVQYDNRQGYGYTNDLGKFILIDAITDVASTAILANALSDRPAQASTNTAPPASSWKEPAKPTNPGKALMIVLGIIGVFALGAYAFTKFQ